MSPPKNYVKRTSFTRASDEMLRILAKSPDMDVRIQAYHEMDRRESQ